MNEVAVAARARRAFLNWIDRADERGRVFLQLHVGRGADARYQLRHMDDAGAPLDRLTCYQDPRAALEIARTAASGRYRPLRSTPDLRRGWVMAELDESALWGAVSRLYPGAAIHWFLQCAGELAPVPWERTAGRQSGMYARVKELRGCALHAAVRACCEGGMCLRARAWRAGNEDAPISPHGMPGQDEDAAVPCREACSLFVSFAREALEVEAELAAVIRLAPSRQAREQLADACRTAALRMAADDAPVGTADFADHRNPRRLRYWAERLAGAPEVGAPFGPLAATQL
jgi:hypothetical protein